MIFHQYEKTNPAPLQSLLAPLPRPAYDLIVSFTNLPSKPPSPMRLLTYLIASLALFFLSAANQAQTVDPSGKIKPETPKKIAANKASVKSLGEHRYQIGNITFNGKTREIRFPATMNLEKGLLEYVLVTEEGKIHESLLSTNVRPAQLQIALKLCHYSEGVGDTFDALFPEDEKKGEAGKANRGSTIQITVEWIEKSDDIEKPRRFQIGELIRDLKTDGPMEEGQWIYTGSIIYEGSFIAETEGTLIAVYIDNGSLINSFHPGSDDDDRWITNAQVAPKMGTPITLVLSPGSREKPATK